MPQAPASEGDEDLPPRPQPPADSDCCRGGCQLCVFDLYERDLERWQERVEEIRRQRGSDKAAPIA
jgi:hypothetical protein